MYETLTATDGHDFQCWFEPAQGVRRGGIVIVQEIFGLTDQLKGIGSLYAAEGYEVAIPALFDRQERDAVIPFDQAQKGMGLMNTANIDETMMDIGATVDALAAKGGKVGLIGFCWGGGLALRSAQLLDLAASVAFYGTRMPSYLDRPLKAPFMAHFGTQDSAIPPEQIAEVEAYLPSIETHLYDAGHAFANDARPAYVAEAAELAHARTKAFFEKHVG
ncbi:MAG: dienelactone hydrolase family protein [Pseudomonadota bacterium]|nr:dienelactone hydrolase family protein [Pseudomonadota bacterium]